MKRVALLVLLIGYGGALAAHEMGTTRVNATFHRDATYRIDIVVDPETLIDRLTFLSTGKRLPALLPPDVLPARITAQSALLLQQIEIRFDGTAVTPRLQYVPLQTDAAALTGIIRLEGSIPPHARTFQWRYALPYAPYLLTLNDEATPGPERQWVEGEAPSGTFKLGERAVPLTRGQAALLYLKLGFTHIIPKGLDHILFVLGIFLLSTRWRDLFAQITAFTVAHSVTLALSIYKVVHLPATIVEPAIALSIAYVGLENAVTKTIRPWRLALVFCFGLLHGMGFAGVLQDLGIPRSEFLTALVAFNVGVEFGQLSVVALAFLLIASWARNKPWYRQRVVIPCSFLIAVVGLYWTIERTAW